MWWEAARREISITKKDGGGFMSVTYEEYREAVKQLSAATVLIGSLRRELMGKNATLRRMRNQNTETKPRIGQIVDENKWMREQLKKQYIREKGGDQEGLFVTPEMISDAVDEAENQLTDYGVWRGWDLLSICFGIKRCDKCNATGKTVRTDGMAEETCSWCKGKRYVIHVKEQDDAEEDSAH